MQIDDELGVKLHDRTTRGQQLSAEEQVQLQAWYEEKDREEEEMFRRNRPPEAHPELIAAEIKKLEPLLLQLLRQNEELAAQNEALRQEIRALRLLKEPRSVRQPAA